MSLINGYSRELHASADRSLFVDPHKKFAKKPGLNAAVPPKNSPGLNAAVPPKNSSVSKNKFNSTIKSAASGKHRSSKSKHNPAPALKKESIFRRLWQTLKSSLCCFMTKRAA